LSRWRTGSGVERRRRRTGRKNAKYHCDLTGNCYRGPAINAKQIQCAQQTLAKNALGIGLDIAGFIPGESLAVTVAQVGIGTVSAVNSAANGDVTGAFGGIAGVQIAALAPVAKSAGWGMAKSIPGIGTILNMGLTGRDLYNAYADYQSCLAGH